MRDNCAHGFNYEEEDAWEEETKTQREKIFESCVEETLFKDEDEEEEKEKTKRTV